MTEDAMLADALEARVERRADRRNFFRTMGLAAAAGGGLMLAAKGTALEAQSITDGDVLNFALNLEYLEAQFYHFAVFGTSIPANDQLGKGTQGAATGGRQVNFSDTAVAKYAREIAMDEIKHVEFLRKALGSGAVAQPAIDIGTDPNGAFSTAARAAGLIGPGQSFDPYASDENFLLAAYIFEDVGVTAYKGAATLINNKTFVEAAAGIMAVEAYHAAMVRSTLYAKGITTPSLIQASDKISDARDSLDGPTDDDQGLSPTQGVDQLAGSSNIVPLDGNGLAYGRSTGQVLNIVYLNSMAATAGGFFPNGVNGVITASASH